MVLLRRAEPDDQQAIAAVIGRNTSALRQRYGRFKVVQLIESSFLSVVALDEEGAVVGFACFEDAPNVSGVEGFLCRRAPLLVPHPTRVRARRPPAVLAAADA